MANALAFGIQRKLVRVPSSARMTVDLSCSLRIAQELFPELAWRDAKSSTIGGFYKYVMIPPSGGDMIAELQACLRMPNDVFCRRYYTHTNIEYADGSVGRVHDCTAMVLDYADRPITVTWKNQQIKQVLPDLTEVKIDQGRLSFTFFATPDTECDTTVDCAPSNAACPAELVRAVESLQEKVIDLNRKGAHKAGRIRALMLQLEAAGLAPTKDTVSVAKFMRLHGKKRKRK